MITAADAHSMTVMTIAENKKKLLEKEIYEIECAISKAINDGLFYTGASVMSEPSEIAAVLEKQGFEVTFDSSFSLGDTPTFCRISWMDPKTTQSLDPDVRDIKFLPMEHKRGPWVD